MRDNPPTAGRRAARQPCFIRVHPGLKWIVAAHHAAFPPSCARARRRLTSALMAEDTLWSGTSSQYKNFWAWVLCILVIPIPWAIYRWLTVKTTTYRLTTERLLTERGILNKVTDTLELYRVRDMQVTAPFTQR